LNQECLLLPTFPNDWDGLKFLLEQKVNCVMILPAINAPWVNLVSAHMTDLLEISKPFQIHQFSVLNQSGKRVPKKYPHAMIAVKLCFDSTPSTLQFCKNNCIQ